MGRPPRRAVAEVSSLGGGTRLFLFDENVTSIGRALAHVYEQVVVLEDTEGLGRGADDEKHIIPWCVEHQAVWVTKDWHRRRNPEQARQLHHLGVSAAWFRPRGKRELTVELLLAAAARAMPELVRLYASAGVRYAVIDDRGHVTPYALHLFLSSRE
jgi:hypothetical protein